MVAINLLPWRETKLKRKRKCFFVQILGLLCLTFVFSGLLWAKNMTVIKNQLASINDFKVDNHDVFSQLEAFQAAHQKYLKQQQKAEQINQLINKRQVIPQLLAMLENKKIIFQVNYLLVNHENLKLIGTDVSSHTALSLLSTLREEAILCQLTFTPYETKQSTSSIRFELQAQICNEHAD